LKYLIPFKPKDGSAREVVRISMMMYQLASENQAKLWSQFFDYEMREDEGGGGRRVSREREEGKE
jgi:hypothetical protein